MLVNTLLRNVNRNMRTMQKKQDQLSTGKRVSAPSDDPVAISKILKYKTKINELEQYDKNSKDALSWTQTSELAIADISNALNRARELAVQAANETNSVTERENIAKEIDQLKDHIIGNANKTFAGKYIFSAFQTDKKLLNDDGTFNINVTEKELTKMSTTTYEVGVGETVEVSTNGLDLFGAIEDMSNTVQKMPYDSKEGARGTQGKLIGKGFVRNADYSGGTLGFTINGTSYNVDTSDLDGTTDEIDNQTIVNAINSSTNGTNTLDNVANVYFNSNNDLIIEAKTYGVGSTVTYDAGSLDLFNPALASDNVDPGDSFSGTDLSEAVIQGTIPPDIDQSITDAEIATDAGNNVTNTIVVEYFGETKEITVDISGEVIPQTVTEYASVIENKLNSAFADKIQELNDKMGTVGQYGINVTGNSGTVLSFQTNNSVINGPVPSLNVRTVKSQKSEMMQDLDDFIAALKNDDTAGIAKFIGDSDQHLENINASRSEIGAKTNRLEMILSRIGDDSINVTQLLSNSQDVDMAETIMLLKNAENVYKASLSSGARVIQPSLLDFLR